MDRAPRFFVINGNLQNNILIYKILRNIHKKLTGADLDLVSLDTYNDIDFDFERDTVFIFDKFQYKTRENLKKLDVVKSDCIKFALKRSDINAKVYDEHTTLELNCEVHNSTSANKVQVIINDGDCKRYDINYIYEFVTSSPKLGPDINNFYSLCCSIISNKLSYLKKEKILRQLYMKKLVC